MACVCGTLMSSMLVAARPVFRLYHLPARPRIGCAGPASSASRAGRQARPRPRSRPRRLRRRRADACSALGQSGDSHPPPCGVPPPETPPPPRRAAHSLGPHAGPPRSARAVPSPARALRRRRRRREWAQMTAPGAQRTCLGPQRGPRLWAPVKGRAGQYRSGPPAQRWEQQSSSRRHGSESPRHADDWLPLRASRCFRPGRDAEENSSRGLLI